jgi:hypothetical protein
MHHWQGHSQISGLGLTIHFYLHAKAANAKTSSEELFRKGRTVVRVCTRSDLKGRTPFIKSFCESCIAVPGIHPWANRFPGQSFMTSPRHKRGQFQRPYQPRSGHRRDLLLRRGPRRCQPRLSLSAFTTDATVDLSPLSNIGLPLSAFIGRDTGV